jgi:uncharacterized protein YdcH (DUF465 family)
MNNWHDINDIFEEIYDKSNYLDGRKNNGVSRKRKWREIEIKKEKLRLQRELQEMKDYS